MAKNYCLLYIYIYLIPQLFNNYNKKNKKKTKENKKANIIRQNSKQPERPFLDFFRSMGAWKQHGRTNLFYLYRNLIYIIINLLTIKIN
ncbi:hypothetical protein F4703DRAFT_1878090, partial [Phycomyces blakesleeanus]